jgi:transposase
MRLIIGCDFHPSYQQIAMFDEHTGEFVEKALSHASKEEVKKFYGSLREPAEVGLEASGQSQWFERLLLELGHRVRIGDAAKIRAAEDRKQKTDRRDARLLLKLLCEGRFPEIWVPTPEERDLRQMLLHRYKLVRLRTQVKNQLQALALNQGLQWKRRLWTAAGRAQLQALAMLPWAARRRRELLQLLDQLEVPIAELNVVVDQEANTRVAARRLMTHPGVGPVTGLAFVLTLGPVQRFASSKQVASYVGLIPSEESSGARRQRLGHISKQGNSFLRGVLVEAAQSAVRCEPQLRREYQRLAQKKNRAVAKVAIARKLAVRLYWMLRGEMDYAQLLQGSHAGEPESSCGRC